MPQEPAIETAVRDLSELPLDQLTAQDGDRFADTFEAFLRRIDEPSQSISGYNPQRLD